MYDDILLATDGSEPARRAAEHAVERAAADGATLHALYVIDADPSPLAVSRADVRETLREVGEQAAEAALTEVESLPAAADIELEPVVVEGHPAECIVSEAAEHDIDLVVMGTHGRPGVSRRLLGSVTERVVRSSPAPVLTVGQQDD